MLTPHNALTTRIPPCGGVALPAGRVAGGRFLQQVSESAKGGGVDVNHALSLFFCLQVVTPNGSQFFGARKNG